MTKTKKQIVLTRRQADTLEMVRDGKSQVDIANRYRIGTLAAYGRVKNLRDKGYVTMGTAGKARSVKPLLEQHEYIVAGEEPINPDWLAWQGRAIPKFVRTITRDSLPEKARLLADMLEDAGCDNTTILETLRTPAPDPVGVDTLFPKVEKPTGRYIAWRPDLTDQEELHNHRVMHASAVYQTRVRERRQHVCPREAWAGPVWRLVQRLAVPAKKTAKRLSVA